MLQFDNGPVLAEDLLNLFRITPTLEDVRLRTPNVVFTSEVLEELTVDHTSSSSKDVVLPRLRHLCMCVTVCQELTRMVQSRWNMGQSCRVERLQTLKLYCLDKQSAEVLRSFVLEELEGCFREGLSFKITYECASCNDLHEIEEMDLPL
ncbi:uncharacterized protein EV420DRAFT_1184231 [Desarmillaria tabescens]|uniref:Uncharacterized protein n=1 Tax=Armillaria tabescens TaxID=1929756 RepID=A0AA39NB38_ARMTA|nr:uncharacterized protein EV420DRAFT_1184231 [Desarmillaria tabescens]KAK0462376.1 hypothetical protein EV420DRAFT_1184231 [Desarmillaria tabescens]